MATIQESVAGGGRHAEAGAMSSLAEVANRKVIRRLLPLITLAYFVAQLDRVNLSFAALPMNADLKFSPEVYGFGAGIFFWGYFLFEVPSNMILAKVGARVWIARIMVTWGLAASCMAFVYSPNSFYLMRFLLGLAEAGFLPGMMLYLSYWIPAKSRAWAAGLLCLAVPLGPALAGPVSSALLHINWFGLAGWKWMFILEGLPAVVLGVVVFFYLDNKPDEAKWLSADEKSALKRALDEDLTEQQKEPPLSFWKVLLDPRVLVLSLLYHTIVLGLYGVVMWFPQIIAALGVSAVTIGLISPIPFCLAAVASIIFARSSDNRSERKWHIAIAAFVAAIGLVASAYFQSPVLVVGGFCLGAIGVYAVLPVFWALPSSFLSRSAAPVGIAVINTLGSFGGFTGPWLVGLIRQETGSFFLALLVLSAIIALGGLLALVVVKNKDPAPAVA
jgi:ACS family tartrate transporter-like MFS transporter